MIYRILLILLPFMSLGQSSFFEHADSLHRGRVFGVSSGIGAVWAGSIIGLADVWYSQYPKVPWHTFDDSREWMQMDKAGHIYTANKISLLTGDFYLWSGFNNKQAAWAGFGVGMGYQFSIEMLDAYNAGWGFSWSDMGANTLGSTLYLGQQLAWKEQRILLKFSARPTNYAAYRPEVMGSTFAERLLKDYNGQTYWLSASPGSFKKNSKFPEWLCFSVGYSVDEKLVGNKDFYVGFDYPKPANGSPSVGVPIEFNAQRQFLFSLDIDFSKLPIKRPWLRALVKQLNYLKIPFPALVITGNKVGGSWMYF